MNPFEQLRDDTSLPADPDPRFAARLRAELEAALSPEIHLPIRKAITMTDDTTTTPAAATSSSAGVAADPPARQIITPYLAVDDAAGALEWYRDALGAIELMRYTDDDGRIGHA